jgi:SAM-dependent methyltransferase
VIISRVDPNYAKGAPIPWWLKIGAKIILSRLPVDIRYFQKIGVFVNSPRSGNLYRNVDQLLQRFDSFQNAIGHAPRHYVEVGVGDSVDRALVAHACGVQRTWLIDTSSYATQDIGHYIAVNKEIGKKGFPPLPIKTDFSFNQLLQLTHANYLTNGLASLKQIPSDSIDIIVSEAVLEHLPRDEFSTFFAEFQRILGPDGMSFHGIDYHDHLGGKLNNLRFSQRCWESRVFRRSGFYTNRISASDMVARIRACGFEVETLSKLVWPEPPIEASKVSQDLNWSSEDLLTCSMQIIAKPVRNSEATSREAQEPATLKA